MTRVLKFDGPKGPRRFELLLTSLVAGGDGKAEGRTPAAIRKEARLLDAFEAVSVPLPTYATDPSARALMADTDTTITLSQEDFELLQSYTEKTAWMPRASRDVVDLWDYLSACEKRE